MTNTPVTGWISRSYLTDVTEPELHVAPVKDACNPKTDTCNFTKPNREKIYGA